ncbi:MAG: hypothetical protein AAGI71_08085 [Bacteroidota bacterium]
MNSASAAAAVEAQLKAREAAITHRLEAISGELNTAGESVKEALQSHPLVRAGGAVALGLLVGLLVGGIGRRRPGPTLSLDGLDAPVQAALQRLVKKDPKTAQAVEHALQARAGSVVVAPESSSSGVLGGVVSTAFRIGLGLVLREGMSRLIGEDSL